MEDRLWVGGLQTKCVSQDHLVELTTASSWETFHNMEMKCLGVKARPWCLPPLNGATLQRVADFCATPNFRYGGRVRRTGLNLLITHSSVSSDHVKQDRVFLECLHEKGEAVESVGVMCHHLTGMLTQLKLRGESIIVLLRLTFTTFHKKGGAL